MFSKQILQMTSDQFLIYFHSRGWTDKSVSGRTILTSPGSDDNSRISCLLPPGPDFDDNPLRVLEALTTLSRYSGETVASIEKSLLEATLGHLDRPATINFRMNTRNDGHSIGIDTLESVLENCNRLIAHAVSNELDTPAPWRPKPLPKAADIARDFEFAQTGTGSFVAKIVIPKSIYQQVSFFKAESLSREEKAIVRIIKGLHFAIDWTVDSDTEASYKFGLNANMAAALSNIVKATYSSGAEILFDISNETAKKYGIRIQKFHSSMGLMQTLKNIEKKLIDSSSSTMTISCWVVGLKAQLHKQESLLQTVTFEIEPKEEVDEELHHKRFSVDLEPVDYQIAIDAHTDKRTLEISGVFELEKNKVHLKKFTSLI